MCGIDGKYILNREPVSSHFLKQMEYSLSHRDPNGEGFDIDDSVGLFIEDVFLFDYI